MSKLSQRQAMVSYFNSLLTNEPQSNDVSKASSSLAKPNGASGDLSLGVAPAMALAPAPQEQTATKPLALREDRREELQTLLATVPAHEELTQTTTQTKTLTQVAEVAKTTTEVKTQVQTQVQTPAATSQVQTAVETAVETKPQVATTTATLTTTASKDATLSKVQPKAQTQARAVWKNLETEAQFTALFFKVAGVTLAVPLVNLGGIFEPGTITALFGKPKWNMGLMSLGQDKVSVVDTQKWMLPDIESPQERAYKYVIMLDKSKWCIGCDELIGTKVVSRDAIKWRALPGARPWLAGIVKDEMCALIHVTELLNIFRSGLDMCKE